MIRSQSQRPVKSCFLNSATTTVRIAWVLSLAAMGSWPSTALTQSPAAPSKDQHVIVISLDGLAAYLVDDPKASLPIVRKLAREGAIAKSGMKVSNPSVTWPNHTTMIAGVRPNKHGVLANGILVRSGPGVPIRVEPKADRKDLVRVNTIIDAAHAAGLRTADINWPCTRGSKSFDDSFPDVPETIANSTPRLQSELVQLGLLDEATDKAFAQKLGPARDWVWMEAAGHVIRTRKPNLMLIHLLNVDTTHHALGPQTPAGYTANAYADLCVERIVQATRDAGILDRTTFFIVSDHGFVATPKVIKPNMLLREKGWLKSDESKITEARVHVYPEGGVGLVYCTNPTESQELGPQIQVLFQGREGVADVVLPNRYHELGLPLPREYSQAPDAVLVAQEGYAVSASADGPEFTALSADVKASLGSHGFVSDNAKMNGLCVLWGNRIRAGVELTEVENIDLAPTIATLLNLPLGEVDGKVLKAALQ